MSGSGKGLLGMWLYRRDEQWTIKEGSPLHKSRDVSWKISRTIAERVNNSRWESV